MLWFRDWSTHHMRCFGSCPWWVLAEVLRGPLHVRPCLLNSPRRRLVVEQAGCSGRQLACASLLGRRHSLPVGMWLPRCGVATHSVAVVGASSTWLGHGLSFRRNVACHAEVVDTPISHISKPLAWQVEMLVNSTLFVAKSSVLSRVRLHPVYLGSF